MTRLSSDRWRVLSPYLDEALDITTDARPAWLEAIGARDASLAADLSTLLAEHQTVHDSHYLEYAVAGTPSPSTTQSPVGQVLGAYRLISLVGQGGWARSGSPNGAMAVSRAVRRSSC